MMLTTHLHVVPRLRMNRGILFHSMDRGKFNFQFISESRML